MVDNIKNNWDCERWLLNSLKYGMRWATAAACIGWVFWDENAAMNGAAFGLGLGFALGAIWETKRCQKP